MSLVGKKIQPFKAMAFRNGEFVEVTALRSAGQVVHPLLLPGGLSFVCPTELEDLQEHYDELKKLGVEVYSVSTDTHFVHKAWHDVSPAIQKITYTMISDATHEISRNFDVLIEETGRCGARHVPDRSGWRHPGGGDHGGRHWPRRCDADPEGEGRAVRPQPPGRSLPCEVEGRREDAQAEPRSRRQNLRRCSPDHGARRRHPRTTETVPRAHGRRRRDPGVPRIRRRLP